MLNEYHPKLQALLRSYGISTLKSGSRTVNDSAIVLQRT